MATIAPVRFPTSGPTTRLHTPKPVAASGIVTMNVTTGTMPCRLRCLR